MQAKHFLKAMDAVIIRNLPTKHIRNIPFLIKKKKYATRINGEITLEDLMNEAEFPINLACFTKIILKWSKNIKSIIVVKLIC